MDRTLSLGNAELELEVGDIIPGSIIVTDKTTNKILTSPEGKPSIKISGWKPNGEYITFSNLDTKTASKCRTLSKNRVEVKWSFPEMKCDVSLIYTLERDWFEVRFPIKSFQESTSIFKVSHIQPLPWFGALNYDSKGYLFVPDGAGGVLFPHLREPSSDWGILYDQPLHNYPYMFMIPGIGITNSEIGFVGILSMGEHNASIGVEVDSSECNYHSVSIRHNFRTSPRQTVDYVDRIVRYYILCGDKSSYVGMAKKYREFLLKEKKLKPINLVAKKNSAVDYFKDGLLVRILCGMKQGTTGKGEFNIYCTFKQAEEILQTMKDAGVEKAVVQIAGWNQDGHEGRCPTNLPPDQRLGGEKGLKGILSKGQQLGYMVTLHDIYYGAYEVSPEWNPADIAKNLDGSLMDIYDESFPGGKGYTICPKIAYEKFASRDLPKIAEMGFRGIYYIDQMNNRTITCYDPNHPVNRRQCAYYWNKIISLANELFGGTMSEGNCAFGIPPTMSSLHILYFSNVYGSPNRKLIEKPVPFFSIAYHGLFLYSEIQIFFQSNKEAGLLQDLELGCLPVQEFCGYAGGSWNYNKFEKQIKETAMRYKIFCKELGDLQTKFIDNHREITPEVHETIYEDSTRIVVNYGDKSYYYLGKRIEPKGFAVFRVKTS
jgi:hypothetical protein